MNQLYPWQTELWQRWNELRARQPHALLLKGLQGIGKFDFAMTVARSILCEQPLEDGLACQSCPSCHWFGQDTHPDFRLLQPASLSAAKEEEGDEEKQEDKKPARQISVGQIRALADFYSLTAHQGGYRVVLIHPAETMNINAANALLKMLEEPHGQLMFILVSHKPQQLLPTILSRCLVLPAAVPPVEASMAWLRQQKISSPAAMLAQAGFAPLQAVRLAQDAQNGEERDQFLQAISRPSSLDIYSLAGRLHRAEPGLVVHWLQQWCYDLGAAKLAGKVRYHAELAGHIAGMAANVDMHKLLRYQKELVAARRAALHTLNPKLLLESLLLGYKHTMQTGT